MMIAEPAPPSAWGIGAFVVKVPAFGSNSHVWSKAGLMFPVL